MRRPSILRVATGTALMLVMGSGAPVACERKAPATAAPAAPPLSWDLTGNRPLAGVGWPPDLRDTELNLEGPRPLRVRLDGGIEFELVMSAAMVTRKREAVDGVYLYGEYADRAALSRAVEAILAELDRAGIAVTAEHRSRIEAGARGRRGQPGRPFARFDVGDGTLELAVRPPPQDVGMWTVGIKMSW